MGRALYNIFFSPFPILYSLFNLFSSATEWRESKGLGKGARE